MNGREGPRTAVGIWVVIDVVLGGIVWRIAADVRVSFPLVHTNVVNLHDCREDHRGQVDGLPVA